MKDFVPFLQELIRLPSLSGSAAELACSQRAVAEMQALGFDAAWVDVHRNAIGVCHGRSPGPAWLLVTHPDVVNVGDLSQWAHPPFDAVRVDDVVHGRGAVDIKGPLVASIHAVHALIERGQRPEHDVVVIAAADEEIGGAGMAAFVRGLPLITPAGRRVELGACIVCEPSSNRVMLGHRGVFRVLVRFHGKAHHASFDRKEQNPHYAVAEFMRRLQVYDMPVHPVLGRSTAAPTMIIADTQSQNVTPNTIMLMLDWRFGMETSADFRGILCELTAGLNATFTVVEPWEFGPHNAQLNGPEGQCARGFAIEPAHPVTQTVLCAARSEMPGTPEPGLWHFATDGRYTAEAGIPTVGFGPGDPSLAHATREHIHVSDIVTAVHVLARAIQDAPPGAEVPSAT